MSIPIATVSALYQYPIKSCRGRAVAAARYDALGLDQDRRWMVVSADGRFLSQRELPRLACIVPHPTAAGGLRLEAAGCDTLEVEAPARAELRPVTIWRDQVSALDAGDSAAQWLQAVLQRSVRLVRVVPDHHRPLQRNPGAPGEVSAAFADAFPFLLISEASLEALNRRLAKALPMNRFRPNIVVSGCAPFAEDGWVEVAIDGQRFALTGPCARCAITTTDQERGVRDGKEPLRTLAAFRRGAADNSVYFGQNVVQLQRTGRLRVGAAVELSA